MNIAILGTRGIPNYYGGFEQCAEYLSDGLTEKGHDVTVYTTSIHPYKENKFGKVNLVHCYDPETKLGPFGLFFYDLNCILHSRKQNFDIILVLGYTSSSIWGWLLPKSKSVITVNMDGLEWKRTKYSSAVRKFLRYAEYLGVKYSDYLIADSIGIQKYLSKTYNRTSTYIPYGSHVFENPDEKVLDAYNLQPYNYNMLVARLEPENNIETILNGVIASKQNKPFIVVGGLSTPCAKKLMQKFQKNSGIIFLDAIYDMNTLDNLRYFSGVYFHGHSVGGTNPSMLEAMGSNALICAHKNDFNEAILKRDGLYFSNSAEVAHVLDTVNKAGYTGFLKNNNDKIRDIYRWDLVTNQYENHFKTILSKKKVKATYNIAGKNVVGTI